MWQYKLTEMTREGSKKETEIRDVTCRDTTDVAHETYDYTGNNWNH
jgi:hypothetical protein